MANSVINNSSEPETIYLNPKKTINNHTLNKLGADFSLGAKFTPRTLSNIACYIFAKEPREKEIVYQEDREVYTCTMFQYKESRISFCNDSYSIFHSLAEILANNESQDLFEEEKNNYKQACHLGYEYSQIIIKCINRLDKINPKTDEIENELANFLNIFKVWELSRILYFQEFDEVGYLASDLMDWLNIYDPFRVSPDQEFINFEEYNPEHHEDPYFWKCVFR
nr:7219_t:CDS:2 [Entrophospora candida]